MKAVTLSVVTLAAGTLALQAMPAGATPRFLGPPVPAPGPILGPFPPVHGIPFRPGPHGVVVQPGPPTVHGVVINPNPPGVISSP